MKINVGIDLGTTYSAVATFNKTKGEVEILKNDLEKKCTPSVICIENGKVTIGDEAKDMQAAGNLNTAAFYKSMMGEKDYTIYIDGKDYTPEDLSSEYLRELKRITEKENGVEIGGAVITVPAYFNEAQRNATLNAGKRAGLNVLKIINEPTSAIIAYGLTGQGKKNVMVYDLGGGTFDVTIAQVDGTKIQVLSTNGNHQLGGKDWDHVLIDELSKNFYDEFGINVEDYLEAYKELQVKCEDAKKKLTNLSSTTVTVQCDGCSGRYEVSRDMFEMQTANLLNETFLLVEKCFSEIGNGFGWQSLDEVVLVGGSTRMPQIKEMIIREYGKPPITKNIDVDTIVAAGAAMQAQLCTENMLVLGGSVGQRPIANLGGSVAPQNSGAIVIRGTDIQDITAHSLGMLALESNGIDFVNSIIVKKNSKINEPFGKNYHFNGDNLEVYVLQGESNDPYDCALLYKYVISGMQRGTKNSFTVNFLYNDNGTVEVNAVLDNGTKLTAKQCEVTETISEIISRLRQQRQESRVGGATAEIMFMIDSSGSMKGEPMNQAKSAIKDFVNGLNLKANPNIKIGLLQFANKSMWVSPFTNDTRALEKAIDSVKLTEECGFGNLEIPLTHRGKEFQNNNGTKIIVILTDGAWVHPKSEIKSSKELKDDGVIIYAIGFGTAKEDFLEEIASEKGARKIDLSMLSTTFKEIASTIATEIS